MHYAGSTGEWAEEADHEIDGVIGWENAEVAHAGREGIERGEGDALFEIVFVGHHTALGKTAGARGIDDGGDVLAFARGKCRFRAYAEFFPAMGAEEIGAGGGFGDEDSLQ